MLRVLLTLHVFALASAQGGKPTPLLEVDLRSGEKERIDEEERDAADDDLDAALAAALGESAANFSTRDLEEIEADLRDQLTRERPRSPAQMLIFVYPGRVSADRLRRLSEVSVDIELIIDPCDRSVCDDAIGKHIELVGRAVGKSVHERGRYKVVFRTLVIRAVVHFRDAETHEHRIAVDGCVAAAKRPGAGRRWVKDQRRSAEQFEPLVSKAAAREAGRRRLKLAGTPVVSRGNGQAQVSMRIQGSRTRVERSVLDAMAAAVHALRQNPATPPTTEIEIEVLTGGRDGPRRFRAPGHSIGLWLDGELEATTLLASYVRELKKQPGAVTMDFGDEDDGAPVAEANDADAVAALSENFGALGACARDELTRNKAFKGVTITFHWTGAGTAERVEPEEPNLKGGKLASCLQRAMSKIRLPRHGGAPRQITYPILIKQ